MSVSALSLLATSGSQAQVQQGGGQDQPPGWQYSTLTEGRFSLTDNARLSEVDPESDFITSLSLSTQVFNQTRRSVINFNYQFSYDIYFDNDRLNGMRHSLFTQNTFVLADEFLFLDVNASLAERSTSNTLRTPASTRTIDNNRSLILAGVLSPHIETAIADRIGVTARMEYSTVQFFKPDISDTSGSGDDDNAWSGSFSARELDQDKRLYWEVLGRASADDDELEQQSGNLSLKLRVRQNARLIARGGYDRTDGRRGGKDIDNAFWRGGFEIEPIRDSSIRFEAGERFGGPSYDASMRYRFGRALNVTARYDQELRTDQNKFVDFLNAYEPFVPGSGGLGIIVEDPFSPYFGFNLDGEVVEASALTDNGRVTLSGSLGKIRYTLTGGYLLREFEENLGLEGPFEEETTTATLSVSRDIGRRSSVRINGRYTDQESDLPTLGEDAMTIVFGKEIDVVSAGIGTNYDLSPTARLTLDYTWSEREDQLGAQVEENVVVLTISKSW